jgi:putative oxygen-independent coproporphyrinogen III oxidase
MVHPSPSATTMPALPPISLYIHFPWCIKKCPYCDFNSHQSSGALPEAAYTTQLKQNLLAHASMLQQRPIHSIFIGGGTPSLIAPSHIVQLLEDIDHIASIPEHCEITMEANPGASDEARFKGYRQAGVNRLSIGIQSFQASYLKALGRIHDGNDARQAVAMAHQAGFDHVNIDLMFGLPKQSLSDAMLDLAEGIKLQPQHLSWYQLTIEPNTAFHAAPPPVPSDDRLWQFYQEGYQQLQASHYHGYEVSAYAQTGYQCQHNLNYWHYGDYIGLGAGAHSKVTYPDGRIVRFSEARSPKRYLQLTQFGEQYTTLDEAQRIMEFMMNALRMSKPLPLALFEAHTQLPRALLQAGITQATQQALMVCDEDKLQLTDKGRQYLNEVVLLF